jgi:hypothetical protein
MIILMIGLAYQDDGVTHYDYQPEHAFDSVAGCVVAAGAENRKSGQHAYCTLEVFAPLTSPRPIARP